MPKAWPVPKLDPALPVSRAAALILQVKLPEVLHYERGAQRGRIKQIHDMRVGAKRLREAVRVLKPAIPTADRRRLLPTVEQLNDLLGEVRDRDVLRQAFEALAHDEPAAAVPQKLLRELKRERKQHHATFLKFLADFHASDFESFYAQLMKQMLKASRRQQTIGSFAAEAIADRLQAVADNMKVIHETGSSSRQIAAFHRQRIRVKKLKYALEPFLTVLPPEVQPLYDAIAELQELMGLVHDADVQEAVLAQWEQKQGADTGTEAARALLRQRREKLAAQTAEHARQMEQDGVGEQLLRLVETTLAA